MKELLAIVIILLLISVALNVYQGIVAKETQKNALSQNRANQEAISKHLATAQTAMDSVHLERAKRIRGDSLAKSLENGLRMRVAAYEKTLIKQRIPIQPLIDSIQALGDFVETYDSLSTAKDSLILSLNGRIDTLQRSYNREIRQIEHAYANQQQVSKLWEGQANNFKALYNEADKKARKKFSVGPYVGYGVSKEGLSPSIGLSIQWKLLAF